MKKLRIISLIAAMALVFSMFCCTAFASEDVTSGADVTSSTDVETVSASDFISDYELVKFEVYAHRLSMLVPDLENIFTANSTNTEISSTLSGYTLEDIISYNDTYYSGNTISYLYSGTTDTSEIMINVLYTSNNYTQLIGNYSRLDDAALEDIRKSTYSYSGTYPDAIKLNGNTFLYAEGADDDYGYYSYTLETIVNGGRYQIYIDVTDPSPADKAVVNEIIQSIRIGGFRTTLYGAADSKLVTALLIAVIVLAVIVILLAFFIVRFSLFSSAAGNKFNIIGFNMPPSKKELAEIRKKQAKKKNQSTKNGKSVSIVDSFEDVD